MFRAQFTQIMLHNDSSSVINSFLIFRPPRCGEYSPSQRPSSQLLSKVRQIDCNYNSIPYCTYRGLILENTVPVCPFQPEIWQDYCMGLNFGPQNPYFSCRNGFSLPAIVCYLCFQFIFFTFHVFCINSSAARKYVSFLPFVCICLWKLCWS